MILKVVSRESGAAILVFAAICLLAVGLYVLVTFRGNTYLIESRLQSAADAAALAGAGALVRVTDLVDSAPPAPACSGFDCLNDSLLIAIGTIEHLSQTGSLQSEMPLLLDVANAPSWNFGDLGITIERGRYAPDLGFESVEGEWQEAHPGMPAVLVANAVRVIMRRRYEKDLFSFYTTDDQVLTVTSIATVGEFRDVPAAPLAVPACALIRDNDFEAESLCDTELYFTSIRRHCPTGDPNCGVLPDFNWDPEQPTPEDQFAIPYNLIEVGNRESTCSWSTPHAAEYGDNYAVLGMTQAWDWTSEPTEAEVMFRFNTPDDVKLGDAYWVLRNGLQLETSNDFIWGTLFPDFPLPTAAPYWEISGFQASDLRGHIENSNYAFTIGGDRNFCSPTTGQVGGSPPRWRRPTFGACNSMRTSFGHWGTPCAGDDRPPQVPSGFSGTPPAEIEDVDVLRVTVPVIADPDEDAEPCAGILDATEDPPLEKAGPYEIIGFMDINIFDVDIGKDRPEQNSYCGRYETYPEDPNYRFGFWPDWLPADGSVEADGHGRCNLIRGRPTCENRFIGVTDQSMRIEARLVE